MQRAPDHETRHPSRNATSAARVSALEWRWRAFDALSGAELHAALALRAAVFVVEQACLFLDPDPYDLRAHHLLGFVDSSEEVGRELIAYLRVLPPASKYAEPSIGRVVTAASHRRCGFGRALMGEGLRRAAELHPGSAVRISAQEYLRPFYESFGFRVVSTPYLEDGIPHLQMLCTDPIGGQRRGIGS